MRIVNMIAAKKLAANNLYKAICFAVLCQHMQAQ